MGNFLVRGMRIFTVTGNQIEDSSMSPIDARREAAIQNLAEARKVLETAKERVRLAEIKVSEMEEESMDEIDKEVRRTMKEMEASDMILVRFEISTNLRVTDLYSLLLLHTCTRTDRRSLLSIRG